MPNWERTPPVSGLSIEEMKKRVAAGIKRRRQSGELRPEGLKPLKTLPGRIVNGKYVAEPALTKKQRRVLIRAAELAIYSLANNERHDYVHAAVAINAVRRQAGMRVGFMGEFLKGIAAQAAELSGEKFELLDQVARTWLAEALTPSGKVISIPRGQSRDQKHQSNGEYHPPDRQGHKP